MTSGSPSTPAKVAASATSYTPATLDPDLRSQINSLLIRDGHVTKIQDHLLHSLHAHPTNWPTAIQTHALTLLRSGEVTTFPALLRRVMDDVRQDTALASGGGAGDVDLNGSSSSNGNNNNKVNGSAAAGEDEDKNKKNKKSTAAATTIHGLAVPQAVVEEALKVTRESLETICEIEGDGAT
ncbi:hypothetical protein QBC33DRAFT_532728 [Phialemonium atrogriseum]|uniref:Uncharacterized protein n=1 Tax=Phialemonium atrogriseum TaxID=1093897 RepID=A0AAJ0FI43_9PEZI|nr:uncharacterized protein QBC33DRAFT_532728 [Phialemonium atrogriseum]KAK1769241.1 hypothetical protein QBC33DRAFT_532728 [Phialemonium atrogriseum]